MGQFKYSVHSGVHLAFCVLKAPVSLALCLIPSVVLAVLSGLPFRVCLCLGADALVSPKICPQVYDEAPFGSKCPLRFFKGVLCFTDFLLCGFVLFCF